MAIYCEFINLIIPISKIESVYKGGFTKFKEDNAIGFSRFRVTDAKPHRAALQDQPTQQCLRPARLDGDSFGQTQRALAALG